MINRIVILGRIASDIDLAVTGSGLNVVAFRVAVDRDFKTDGEKVTDFIPVVAWRQTAEFVAKYFTKGDMIAVDGRLETRQYEDKSGAKRTAYEIAADKVSFCGDSRRRRSEDAVQTDGDGVLESF